MSDLFRKEVVDKQGQKLFGDIVLASPLSHVAIAILIATIVIGLILFAIFGEYARKERVTGYLTPDKGLIRIVPRQAGIIEQVHINSGDNVDEGDRLFSIKIDTISGFGTNTAGTILGQLETEKSELMRRRSLIPRQYKLSRFRLQDQIAAANAEAIRLDERIDLQEKTVNNQRVVLERIRQVKADDAASDLEVSTQENTFLQASQTLATLKNEKERYLAQAVDLQAEYRLLPISEQQELSEITSRLSSLEQRVTQTQGQERLTITAPVSGRVASLIGRTGQNSSPQRSLATIIPEGGKLEAELLVPSRAAGFVKEGQNARLLYDAFPYQKFGFHSGTVSQVSRTVVNASDLGLSAPSQEPVFIITIALDRQDVDANNEVYQLQAGMTLSADIILEDRKIWEWVFGPILGAADN